MQSGVAEIGFKRSMKFYSLPIITAADKAAAASVAKLGDM